jgi:hypothetical protein
MGLNLLISLDFLFNKLAEFILYCVLSYSQKVLWSRKPNEKKLHMDPEYTYKMVLLGLEIRPALTGHRPGTNP